MIRTYTFVFDPDPEGGYTVTCPALPGLVTYGETIEEARRMARDALEGLIDVMNEEAKRYPKVSRWKGSDSHSVNAPLACYVAMAIRVPDRLWTVADIFAASPQA